MSLQRRPATLWRLQQRRLLWNLPLPLLLQLRLQRQSRPQLRVCCLIVAAISFLLPAASASYFSLCLACHELS